MEYIWADREYRAQFIALPQSHPRDFSEFCNLLINDMNTLLFDGLLALEEIKTFEDTKEETETWNSLPEEVKEQMEGNFKEKKRTAKGSFQLSNMVTELLAKVTDQCPEPFVTEELGAKFAQAVNFCLDQMASEKGLKFKIKNPERFYFEPKPLLVNLVTMYANMSHLDVFKRNVVLDGRSYSNETFEKAVKILNSAQKNINVD